MTQLKTGSGGGRLGQVRNDTEFETSLAGPDCLIWVWKLICRILPGAPSLFNIIRVMEKKKKKINGPEELPECIETGAAPRRFSRVRGRHQVAVT